MRGYNATHTKDMELAIGFNTSVDCITKYGGNFYDFGRALKVLLSDITPVGHITQISAAIDAEQGYYWMHPDKVRPIIDGFNEQYVPGYYSMYDFGDDELGTNPGSAEKTDGLPKMYGMLQMAQCPAALLLKFTTMMMKTSGIR